MIVPYYQDSAVTIYHGDCRKILPQLEPVDLVLTDPPYGVRGDEIWDDLTSYDFAALCMQWMSAAVQLSPRLMAFCSDASTIRTIATLLYPRVRQLIWHKPLGSQYAGSQEAKRWFSYEVILDCYPGNDWETCKPKTLEVADQIRVAREERGLSRGGVDMVLRGKKTGLCYRWEEAACLPTREQAERLKELLGLDGKFDSALAAAQENTEKAEKADVLIHRTVTGSEHSCEKPLALLRDLLSLKPAATILDPFCGTGGILRAAKDLGRKAIGIEIEERYCEIAAKRMAQEVLEFA